MMDLRTAQSPGMEAVAGGGGLRAGGADRVQHVAHGPRPRRQPRRQGHPSVLFCVRVRVCVYLRASRHLQPVSKARRFPLYSRVEAEAGRVRGSDEGCVHRAYACVCVCVSGN